MAKPCGPAIREGDIRLDRRERREPAALTKRDASEDIASMVPVGESEEGLAVYTIIWEDQA